ncbi:MAG: ABC transporter, ATP-binding/permease protein [Candidatus Carbobacillus altaicus]|uniref:ABC transporter, ATP-binding/permease protein n=1 Tax=Candidatus Carbonibacillus altaicus TaxID=2163959 RepID=A0A2R6Y262_9BACL|nr:MAG: ABC transporter, ATP-binding/permease protein [Candidatus Carbobacillus altaicus]
MRIFISLGWFFKQEKKSYIIGVLALVLIAFINLLPPYLVGQTVDAIRTGTLTTENLGRTVLLIMAVAVISYGLRYVWRLYIFGSAFKLGMILRNRLFHHLSRLTPEFYQRHPTGELMAHATNDVQAVESAAGEGVMTLVDTISMGGMVVVTMLFLDWKLTLIALIPMPAIAWATMKLGDAIYDRFEASQSAFSDLTGLVQENMMGMRALRAFGQEGAEIRRFAQETERVAEKNIAVARIEALFGPVITFFVGVSYMLTVGFGAYLIAHGTMTIGTLTSFLMYLGHLVWPMLAFGFLFNIMERGRASYDRITRILAEEPKVVEKAGALQYVPHGPIAFHIESFTYPGAHHPALQGIHVTVQPGETLGVVGKTGSGKSTLMHLLIREFDLPPGSWIKIGGVLLEDLSLDALRKTVATVPQDHTMFSATIRENIAFARPDASQEEIEKAALSASIHEDIMRLPNGYDTLVGERGVTLSGGQRQRIAIARAILLDPPVLVLDDALSAVDGKTEAAIIDHLKTLRRGKTTIIKAHRLSAVQHADEIIVLEEGRIRERGTHEALIAQGGWYAQMVRIQKLSELVEGAS